MFGSSWRVGRIAGVEVRIDSSWVVIALLIAYSMYLRFSILYRDLSGGGAVGLGILATVLFFGSVLVHELAHAVVSRPGGSGQMMGLACEASDNQRGEVEADVNLLARVPAAPLMA